MSLTREQILAVDDLPHETVAVPEWGGELIIRGLTGRERDAYEQSLIRGRGVIDYDNARAKLLVRCIIDESGERLFAENDADALGRKAGAVLDRLFAVAARLSGVGPGDVEELMGNLGREDGGGSPSPSRASSR